MRKLNLFVDAGEHAREITHILNGKVLTSADPWTREYRFAIESLLRRAELLLDSIRSEKRGLDRM